MGQDIEPHHFRNDLSLTVKNIPRLNPQPIEQMRARFDKALQVVFQYGPNADQMPAHIPGPVNQFDFSDGMRICVTRDSFGERAERHVSVSMLPGTQLWNEVKARDGFGFVSQMMFKLLQKTAIEQSQVMTSRLSSVDFLKLRESRIGGVQNKNVDTDN